MSGPIVRKYGFPNFEKIFGERGLEHGVDEGETPDQPAEAKADSEAPSALKSTAKPASGKPKNAK
jgi:hypothetical protein